MTLQELLEELAGCGGLYVWELAVEDQPALLEALDAGLVTEVEEPDGTCYILVADGPEIW